MKLTMLRDLSIILLVALDVPPFGMGIDSGVVLALVGH